MSALLILVLLGVWCSSQAAPIADRWSVTVYTAGEQRAGTDANIFISIYGRVEDGVVVKSDEIKLDNEKNNFESGKVDKFTIETIHLGAVYQMRVFHDNSGVYPAWKLDRIELVNLETDKHYRFKCNCWLDQYEGLDKRIDADVEQIVTWSVTTVTSKERNAGTDANVYIIIYGNEPGPEGRSLRTESVELDSEHNNFEKGKVDNFRIETLDVGKAYQIAISHDNAFPYAEWKLDLVELENLATGEQFTFKCNCWLSISEGLQKIIPAIERYNKEPEVDDVNDHNPKDHIRPMFISEDKAIEAEGQLVNENN